MGFQIRAIAGFAVAVFAIGSVTAASPTRPITVTDAAPHADSVAVAAVVQKYHHSLSSGDSASALALLAKDAVILESGGVETRGDYRSHHLAGDIEFARGVKSVRGPVKVTLAGSTAWTTSTSTTQGDFKGRVIDSVGAESMVLTRSGTAWQIRSIHWSSRNRRPPKT